MTLLELLVVVSLGALVWFWFGRAQLQGIGRPIEADGGGKSKVLYVLVGALLAATLPNPHVRNPAKPGSGMSRIARIVERRSFTRAADDLGLPRATVTDAINRGAIYRFLTKPWNDDDLREHIRQAFTTYENQPHHRAHA